jgi:hypothetical protein
MAKKTFIQKFRELVPELKKKYVHTKDEAAFGNPILGADGNVIPGYESVHWAGRLTLFAADNIIEGYDTYRAVLARSKGITPAEGERLEEYLQRAVEAGKIDSDPLVDAFPGRAPNRRALFRAIMKHKELKNGQKTVTVYMLIYLLGAASDVANGSFTERAVDVYENLMPKLLKNANNFVSYVPEESQRDKKDKAEIEAYEAD